VVTVEGSRENEGYKRRGRKGREKERERERERERDLQYSVQAREWKMAGELPRDILLSPQFAAHSSSCAEFDRMSKVFSSI